MQSRETAPCESAPRTRSVADDAAAYPWVPDLGDGTYRNPVLYADYSDPDVIRHGDDFFLTASSFNCTPGLPILHSRDLVNWSIVAHALKNVPGASYEQVRHGCGVWAPSIRFHQGQFWIFFPTPDEGIFVITAADPRGPWSEPHLLLPGKGLIDPCPLWDDDGRAYLVHAYARSRCGIADQLRIRPMSSDGRAVFGEGEIVFHSPSSHPTVEGPKFLKKDGWYYILAPAGGVTNGWQLVLRSKHIYGPYEERVVLEQGASPVNGPHQGALVDLPDGEWWFIHFQDAGVYGRVVHLQPVEWKDGWPSIGRDQDGNGIGEPVMRSRRPRVTAPGPIATPNTSDEFDSTVLGLQWQWHANHKENWYSLTRRNGWLRLFATHSADANLLQAPSLLMQKFPARSFEIETVLDGSELRSGDEAGLVIMGRKYAALALRKSEAGTAIVFRETATDHHLGQVQAGKVTLRVRVNDGGLCHFQFANIGKWVAAPNTFQATPGHWLGAKVGIYCIGRHTETRGHADFDYFRFAGAG